MSWNGVTLDNFFKNKSFYLFSSHPYLYCHAAFRKKTFSPSCTTFQIRCTATHTWHTKRKGKLLEYFDFCDQKYQAVLKHLLVCWLSSEKCAVRVLKKFPSLRSYCLSEHFSDGRFQRLNEWFSDPLLKPTFLFTQATISIFTNFNLLLQSEEPTLHILKSSIERLGRKIANRIVKPSFLKNITAILT